MNSKQLKQRNPIARACGLVNKPKVFRSVKGKGSYDRKSYKYEDSNSYR